MVRQAAETGASDGGPGQTPYKTFVRRRKALRTDKKSVPQPQQRITATARETAPQSARQETTTKAPRLTEAERMTDERDVSRLSLPSTEPFNWSDLRQVWPGVRRHINGEAPQVHYFPDDPAARAFNKMRTRLMQAARDKGWRRIAVTSPTRGCGATFTAVNLALSLSRIPGSKTALLDCNLRNPGVADALDLGADAFGDGRGFLQGEGPLAQRMVRVGTTLALGLTAKPQRGAAEFLHDPSIGERLDQLMDVLRPGLALFDLPSMLDYDDFCAVCRHLDAVLIVADGTKTVAQDIADCELMLQDQLPVMGVVLNQARDPITEMAHR